MLNQFVFKLGITCQGCVGTVDNALRDLDFLKLGLSNKRIDLTQKKLFIEFDPSQTKSSSIQVQQAITKAIQEFGIDCQIDSIEKPKQTYHWLQGSIGLSTGLGLMLLTFLTGGLTIPVMIGLGIASTALTFVLGYRSFINAYTHARYSGTMTMDTLFTISTLSILAVSLAAFFIPGLPMMFEAGLMLFGFRHIGLGIEEAINQKTGVQRNFTDRIAKTVKLKDGPEIETSQIQPGDEIILKNGDVLPVDGSFVDDQPRILNVIRTGNDHPCKTLSNQVINAGAILDDKEQTYIFKAHQTVGNSYLSRLDRLLLSAQQNKAPVENYTDQLLNYFIPGVLAVALLSGLIVGLWISPIMAVQCAAAVLVTACPCTLGMIVPITMKIGMQKGLNHGVAFQSREAIEQAEHIKHVVFDLNGTLTQGTPQVESCQINDDFPKPYLFQVIQLLEKDSKHPIGIRLANYAKDKVSFPPNPVFKNIDVIELQNGRKATININEQSLTYCIGNAKCMRDNGIKVEETSKEPNIYLAENDRIIAKFVVIDPLRINAVDIIKQLQQKGKTVYLLTGADETTADFYGDLLNIPKDNQYADMIPEQKLEKIEQLQCKGPVAMIGDGSNDAIAMKQSNLGIAMQSPFSDEVTNQQADVLISDQSILPVSHIFQISNQTMSILKQNLWFSFTYNAAALLLTGIVLAAIGFVMNPAVGAGLMVLQTSMILLNTYRLTGQTLPTLAASPSEEKTSITMLSKLRSSPVPHPTTPGVQVDVDAVVDDTMSTCHQTEPTHSESPTPNMA